MSQSESLNSEGPDIFKFELLLQEKLNESIWKSKALEQSQQELLKVRQDLLNKELILEENKRTIDDLKVQLSSAQKVVEMNEKEKTKYINERLQLQINCDVAMKERESLLHQAHMAKYENMTLKLDLQKQSETITALESSKKTLESSLIEIKERYSKINSSLQSNISKLKQEHEFLLKSVEVAVHLNKRLQTVGLCAHSVFQKQNEEIARLQKELLNRKNDFWKEQAETNQKTIGCRKIKNMDLQVTLDQIRKDTEKSHEIEMEVETILKEHEIF
ncbi:hypothetical protein TKK_0010077 [Trichogramma kaykai]|uniref:Coiled-coil domain-containing protein 39 n=1 Tax=Trichogramma kaykai TaxID=54128 RepID=A0ABD2WYQ3_9HYME